MFVSHGARGQIYLKRKADFCQKVVPGIIKEAKLLGISKDDLEEIINRHY